MEKTLKIYTVQKLYHSKTGDLIYHIIELVTYPNGKTKGEPRFICQMEIRQPNGTRVTSKEFEHFKEENPGIYYPLGQVQISTTFYEAMLSLIRNKG